MDLQALHLSYWEFRRRCWLLCPEGFLSFSVWSSLVRPGLLKAGIGSSASFLPTWDLELCQEQGRHSRNTWSNRQIWPWNTEWSRAKTNRVFPRKCTGHNKHHLSTTQEKTLHMDITRWSTPKSGWLYSLQAKMEKLCTVNKNKTRSWLWLRSWTPYCQIQT